MEIADSQQREKEMTAEFEKLPSFSVALSQFRNATSVAEKIEAARLMGMTGYKHYNQICDMVGKKAYEAISSIYRSEAADLLLAQQQVLINDLGYDAEKAAVTTALMAAYRVAWAKYAELFED
jgi:hypothetical protein